MSKEPIRVCVTGAAGQIAYSLVGLIASGQVFGADQPVVLNLLDIEPMMGVLNGVVMELDDTAIPLLRSVVATHDPMVAFKDIDYAFLVGAMPRKEGMERKDLLAANVKIFKVQGQALDKVAKKTVKVLVVGNPANTNAFICRYFAPSIPAENFSALTRLDHNRGVAQIAKKLAVCPAAIYNVAIWGNHSNTQVPDLRQAKICRKALEGKVPAGTGDVPAKEAINDDNWVKTVFVPTVRARGAAVLAARKLSSAMSAAKASADHIHDWHMGTSEGKWVSMAVVSDGSYGIPQGLLYSFPVTIKDGKWTIVQGLPIDDELRAAMDASTKELVEERDMAVQVCTASN
jgi:malate dehydrogenase